MSVEIHARLQIRMNHIAVFGHLLAQNVPHIFVKHKFGLSKIPLCLRLHYRLTQNGLNNHNLNLQILINRLPLHFLCAQI